VEITPKVTLRGKMLGEPPYFRLANISECDCTIQDRLIVIQSDDEARVIFHTQGWSDFWIKGSERYPKLWGKVKLLLLAFYTTHFVEQGFCQVLHMRNKCRNRLDTNKAGGTPYDLSQGWGTCGPHEQLIWPAS